jgi:hypothetical protein
MKLPSDLAFLELPDAEIASSYESARLRMRDYDSTPLNLGFEGISIRSIYQPITALQGLGINIDMNSRLMIVIRNAVITNYSILMLQGAYRSIVQSRIVYETALAAAETELVLTREHPLSALAKIALATGAALLVGSALAGYAVGEKIGSGEWNLPGRSITNPQSRRAMERDLRGTGIGDARRRGR